MTQIRITSNIQLVWYNLIWLLLISVDLPSVTDVIQHAYLKHDSVILADKTGLLERKKRCWAQAIQLRATDEQTVYIPTLWLFGRGNGLRNQHCARHFNWAALRRHIPASDTFLLLILPRCRVATLAKKICVTC